MLESESNPRKGQEDCRHSQEDLCMREGEGGEGVTEGGWGGCVGESVKEGGWVG